MNLKRFFKARYDGGDMKNEKPCTVFLLIITVALLASCTTLPKMVKLVPEYYEDDYVKISYAIGTNVHSLEIKNKTDFEITIDTGSCSIITTTGQARTLNLIGLDRHIPPHSSVVFIANQLTFFNDDIYDGFDFENTKPFYDVPQYDYTYYGETGVIESWKGQSIRLYIPMSIGDISRILDINLVVDGVRKNR